jgi:hypothetical protein
MKQNSPPLSASGDRPAVLVAVVLLVISAHSSYPVGELGACREDTGVRIGDRRRYRLRNLPISGEETVSYAVRSEAAGSLAAPVGGGIVSRRELVERLAEAGRCTRRGLGWATTCVRWHG